jgi:hypothetical protein
MKSNYTSNKHEASRNAYSQDFQVGQEYGRKKKKHYRPVATSPWTLIGFLCIIAGYIALLEILLSRRQHEVANSQASHRFDHERRQDGTITKTAAPSAQLSLTSPVLTGTPLSLTMDPTTLEGAQLSLTSPIVVSSAAPSAQLSLTSPVPAGAPLSLTSPSFLSFITSDGAQLSLTSPGVVSASDGAQLSLTSTEGISDGAQLSLTSPGAPSDVGAPSDGAQLSLTSPYVSGTLSAASQCQPTLTYVFGDPYPTGCYQTTER